MNAPWQLSWDYTGNRGRSLASAGWYLYIGVVVLQFRDTLQDKGSTVHRSYFPIEEPWSSGRRTHLNGEATHQAVPRSTRGGHMGALSCPKLQWKRRHLLGLIRAHAKEKPTIESSMQRNYICGANLVELLSSRRPPSPRSTIDAGAPKMSSKRLPAAVRQPAGSPARAGSTSASARRAPSPAGGARSMSAPPSAKPHLTVVRERRLGYATWPRAGAVGPPPEGGARSSMLLTRVPPHWQGAEPAGASRSAFSVRSTAFGQRQIPILPPPGMTSPVPVPQAGSARFASQSVSSSATLEIPQAAVSHETDRGGGEKPPPPLSRKAEGPGAVGDTRSALRVTRSELAAGQQEIISILQQARERREVTTTERREALSFLGEQNNVSMLHMGEPVAAPAAAKEDEMRAALYAALARLLPQEQLYTITCTGGEQMEARRGALVRREADAFVCILVNLYTSANYAGKFYMVESTSRPPSVQELRLLYTTAEERLLKEVAGNMKLLTKATADHLRSICVNVFYGECKLVSRSPSQEEFGDSMVDDKYSVGSISTLMVLTKFVLAPVVGPSLEVLWNSNLSEVAIKFLMYRLVYTLSGLHDFGLAHRRLDSTTILTDNATGFPTLSNFAAIAEFGTRAPSTYTLLRTAPYASPEAALCAVKGESDLTVTEDDDSWAMGVILYMVLCRGRHPWGLTNTAAELGSTLKEEDAVQQFHRQYHTWVTRETFLGEDCLRRGTAAPSLMSIVKLLIDPQKSSRWTIRRLFANHPFFSVKHND